MAKLLLADGSSQIHRTYHALARQGTNLTAPDGTATGALISFLNVLRKCIRKHQPTHLAVTFDLRGPTFRHVRFPAYKAQRDKTPEDLVRQIELARECLAAMRVPVIDREGFEADDVIATLATEAAARGDDVVILSSDKDLLQLVGPHVVMHHALRDQVMDIAAVTEYFGVPPERVADLLAIMGDASDNVPGVKGIGEKGALQLVQGYGDIETILASIATIAEDESLGRLKKRMAQLLGEQAKGARLAKELVTLAHDVPLGLSADDLVMKAPDADATRELFSRLGLTKLLADLKLAPAEVSAPAASTTPAPAKEPAGAAAEPPAAMQTPAVNPTATRDAVLMVTSAQDAHALSRAATQAGRLAIDADILGEGIAARLGGLAVMVPGDAARFIPHGSAAFQAAELRALLADAAIAKTGHALKLTTKALAREGVALRGAAFDPHLASYVLDAARRSHALEDLATEFLGWTRDDVSAAASATAAQGSFAFPNEDDAARRACERASLALQLEDVLRPLIREADLGRVLDELEIPLVPILADMELAGVKVDTGVLESLRSELQARLDALTTECHVHAGHGFNLASPKQLGDVLYDELGLECTTRTATGGRSTAQDVLETLAGEHPIVDLVLEHRELSKLIGTYIEVLPRLVDPRDGRVHTTFHQTVAATGRLSSADPNLQNIPIRSELGRRVRKAFVAEPGFLLVGADYSQIELRIMAHVSEDEALCAAFARGEDVHRATAAKMFHVMPELVTSEMRNRAKVINFGLLYGMTAHGVASRLGCSRAEAKALIDGYFGAYPKLQETVERLIAATRDDPKHEARTIFGRVRRLEEIVSRNGGRRQFSERAAVNTVVQGSAADIIKLAMIAAHARLKAEHPRARLLLQVHDELVVEAPQDEAQAVLTTLISAMECVHELRAPLKAVGGVGASWYSLK